MIIRTFMGWPQREQVRGSTSWTVEAKRSGSEGETAKIASVLAIIPDKIGLDQGGIEMDISSWKKEASIIGEVLKKAPGFDKELRVPSVEFKERQRRVYDAIKDKGFSCGILYSNEQYDGDVPYLGGNTNITVEPVVGVIGKNGFCIMTGLEGGYVVEQMAPRSGAEVHKVQMLQLADEEYPIEASRAEEVIEKASAGKPERIALLTPRAVFPTSIYEILEKIPGGRGQDCRCTRDVRENQI